MSNISNVLYLDLIAQKILHRQDRQNEQGSTFQNVSKTVKSIRVISI